MQVYEDQVRTALVQGKKVIYRVTTVFRGDELMPRGYWSQALSTDGSVNFNVYIWNVQPGINFNYATGRGKADSSMKIAGVTSSNTKSESNSHNHSRSSYRKYIPRRQHSPVF